MNLFSVSFIFHDTRKIKGLFSILSISNSGCHLDLYKLLLGINQLLERNIGNFMPKFQRDFYRKTFPELSHLQFLISRNENLKSSSTFFQVLINRTSSSGNPNFFIQIYLKYNYYLVIYS